MNWYYASAGQQLGPVDQAKLHELVHRGMLSRDSLVWRDDMDGWKPYHVAIPDAPATAQYGGFWIRGLALLIDVIAVGVGYSIIQLPLMFMFGGSGLWFDSPYVVSDQVWLAPAMVGLPSLFSAIWLALDAAYHTYFVFAHGATPGKLVFGLRVITATGVPMTVGLALGRYLASWVSTFVLCIGFIIAAFDPQKRTLHDRICSTRVVRAAG